MSRASSASLGLSSPATIIIVIVLSVISTGLASAGSPKAVLIATNEDGVVNVQRTVNRFVAPQLQPDVSVVKAAAYGKAARSLGFGWHEMTAAATTIKVGNSLGLSSVVSFHTANKVGGGDKPVDLQIRVRSTESGQIVYEEDHAIDTTGFNAALGRRIADGLLFAILAPESVAEAQTEEIAPLPEEAATAPAPAPARIPEPAPATPEKSTTNRRSHVGEQHPPASQTISPRAERPETAQRPDKIIDDAQKLPPAEPRQTAFVPVPKPSPRSSHGTADSAVSGSSISGVGLAAATSGLTAAVLGVLMVHHANTGLDFVNIDDLNKSGTGSYSKEAQSRLAQRRSNLENLRLGGVIAAGLGVACGGWGGFEIWRSSANQASAKLQLITSPELNVLALTGEF